MKKHYCLDVGGTGIKSAVLSHSGEFVSPLLQFDAKSDRSREEILGNFHLIFRSLAEYAPSAEVEGIELAFPGDFDYPAGICRMRGVGKYDSLYNVNLREEFRRMFREDDKLNALAECPILFCNDVEAVAWGESVRLRQTSRGRLLCVCIGTGCGSAFFLNGRPAPPGTPGVPENGWIYCLPYRTGQLDDYLSKRGLQQISREVLGRPLDGKPLAELADAGNTLALECFSRFGNQLAEGLAPILEAFRPDCLSLGGQIMRSRERFCGPLEEFCARMGVGVAYCPDTSGSALHGLRAAQGLASKAPKKASLS